MSIIFIIAPGTYCPEKFKLDHAPQFSFGIRTSLDKISDTPGNCIRIFFAITLICNIRHDIILIFIAPGTYSPEKINLDKGPQYSLTGKGPAEKIDDTPGIVYNFDI